jgi:hypothetical protein
MGGWRATGGGAGGELREFGAGGRWRRRSERNCRKRRRPARERDEALYAQGRFLALTPVRSVVHASASGAGPALRWPDNCARSGGVLAAGRAPRRGAHTVCLVPPRGILALPSPTDPPLPTYSPSHRPAPSFRRISRSALSAWARRRASGEAFSSPGTARSVLASPRTPRDLDWLYGRWDPHVDAIRVAPRRAGAVVSRDASR